MKTVVSREDKCALLQGIFFGWKHLENCEVDDSFTEKVEHEIEDLRGRPDERAEEYLNHEISLAETEAVIQLVK